jgi:Tol biopolymer transport system component/class 3 adenylate cyclase
MTDSGATREGQQDRNLEAAHVLFMDVVGYSRLTVEEQKRTLEELQEVVRAAEKFRQASSEQRLLRLPTGDGMALVFFGDPQAPLQAAVEIGRALRSHPGVKLRMGIHTGPVYRVEDINANINVAGGGVNLAQRVMDCGDAGHILVSADTARFFSQVAAWADRLHDIGKTRVKHGVRLHLFSLYVSEAGNPELPRKLRRERVRRSGMAGGVLLVGVVLAVVAWRNVHGPPPPPPPPVQEQITTNPAARPLNTAAISPNGQYLAYVDRDGIFVRDMDSGEAQALPVPAGEEFSFASPSWSLAWFPDSNRLLVSGPVGSGGLESLWLFPRVGNPRKLKDGACFPAVAADGRIAFVDAKTQRIIWVMESEDAEPRPAITAPQGDWFANIAWSPATPRLAFMEAAAEGNRDFIATVDVAAGETTRTQVIGPMRLTSGPEGEFSGLCWLHDGRILFVQPSSQGSKGSEVWAVPVDTHSGKATGKKALVTGSPGIYWFDLSATGDGKRVAFVKERFKYSVFLGTLRPDGSTPSRLEAFISEESNNWASGWTPDSRYVLFTSDRKGGVRDIYRQALGGGTPEPLVPGAEAKAGAVAMSDGTSTLYWSWPKESGDYPEKNTLQQLPAGQSSPKRLFDRPWTAQVRCALAAPMCVMSEEVKDGLRFSKLDARESTPHFLAAVTLRTSDHYDWDLSPSGDRIGVVHTDVTDSRIRVVSLRDGTASELALPQWGNFEGIAWAAHGKGLYVSSNLPKQASLLYVDMTGSARVLWPSDVEYFDQPIPSPDGKRVAISMSSTGESNAWLMKQF